MTPEEKRRAFEELNELLREGMMVSNAIETAAENNELRPDNFWAFAERQLGDLEKHRGKSDFEGNSRPDRCAHAG